MALSRTSATFNESNVAPVKVEEVASSFQLYMAIARGKIKSLTVGKQLDAALFTGSETGQPYRLTNRTMNHFGLILASQHRDNPTGYQSLMKRFMLFRSLLQHPDLLLWVNRQTSRGQSAVGSYSVLCGVAAKLPVGMSKHFDSGSFLMVATRLARWFDPTSGGLLLPDEDFGVRVENTYEVVLTDSIFTEACQ